MRHHGIGSLAALALALCSTLAAAQVPIQAALDPLLPPHHALRGFPGRAEWYEYRPHPDMGYRQPDFAAWVDDLVEAEPDPASSRFTVVWRDSLGDIRYVLSRGDQARLFTVEGDNLEFEDPGFQTQVGVARWGWEYDGGLLRAHRTWRFTLGPTGIDRPIGPPTPTALFAVTTYEYRTGADAPHQSRTYWTEADRQSGRWAQRTWYDADGKPKKTKRNPERPYPH